MSRTTPGSRPTVLVVEDEALARLNAVAIVEAAGFEAVSASNADEAVHVLGLRDDIRVVFTDVQMPGSMDGLGLIRLIQDRWPTVATLVTSGRMTIADLPGGVWFFPKPYLSHQIEAALHEAMAAESR
jgi:DNA-binding NtrC family response regulator